jgi:hypothetical protein
MLQEMNRQQSANPTCSNGHNQHASSIDLQYTLMNRAVSGREAHIDIIENKVEPLWNVPNAMRIWKKSPTVVT